MNSDLAYESTIIFLLVLLAAIISTGLNAIIELGPVSFFVTSLVSFVVIFVYYYTEDSYRVIQLKKVTFSDLPIVIILSLVILVGIPLFGSPNIEMLNIYNGLFSVVGIVSITFSSIIEEVVYRGFIFGNLKKRTSENVAIIISSILFGLIHFSHWGNLPVLMGLVFLGVAFCIVYSETDNILTCMFLHVLYNLTILFSSFYIF